MPIFFKILGILGLLCITSGIFVADAKKRDWTFVLGGLLLLSYSWYLHDAIFIVLQIIFTLSSVYNIYKLRKAEGQLPISVSGEEIEKVLNEKNTILNS